MFKIRGTVVEDGNVTEREMNDVEQMHYRENKTNGRRRKQGDEER